MADWILYHNQQTMGHAPRCLRPPAAHTNSRVKFAAEDRIWLISRARGEKQYRLWLTFLVTSVASSQGRWARKIKGKSQICLRPPAPLGQFVWFARFRRASGNFQWGPRRLRSVTAVESLRRLAAL